MKYLNTVIPALMSLALVTGCGSSTSDTLADQTPTASGCYPEWEAAGPDNRSSAEEEKGAQMYPGSDCMQCHKAGGVGIDDGRGIYTLGGTLYSDELGTDVIANAVIEVTDANGTVTTLTSNSAGNFYTENDITYPASVKVTNGSEEKVMFSDLEDGSCASCHACEGSVGAKVWVP